LEDQEQINFFTLEYGDQVREQAEYALAYLRHFESVIQNPTNIRVFPRIQEYEQSIRAAIERITLLQLDWLGGRTNDRLIETARETEAYLFFELNRFLKELEDLISERTGSRFPIFEHLSKIGLKDVSSSVQNAMDNALHFFMKCYFGASFRATFACMTEVDRDFRIRPIELHRRGILTVDVPQVELTRTRLWSGLAHEAAHHRLRMIQEFPPAGGMEALDHLFHEVPEALEEIGWTYVRKRQKCPETVEALSRMQFFEMLADIGSTIVIGPESLFGLLCYNPPVAEHRFTTHPPLAVRVDYLFGLLERIGGPTLAEVLRDLKRAWNDYHQHFGRDKTHREFVDQYLGVLRPRYESLFSVGRSIVAASENDVFNTTSYKKVSEAAERKKLENLGIVELLNVPLYRRWSTYREMVENRRNPVLSRAYEMHENRLTRLIVKQLTKLHRT